ncbi:MAG: 1,4-dihydroxy-2-naphthoate octaprenyltransferase, partial [Chitinophagales bacterium]|nr:1,4-dihydroxy-2-naphthoate octaprenyltransferase [Chitinophagales bacterium]
PEYFNTEILVWCLITTLLLQILSNLANDLGDSLKGADNEFRIGPKRVVQRGLLSLSDMKWGIAVCAFLSLCSGLKLLFESFGNEITKAFFFLFLIGIGAICAAITYTLGKNAYGYKGLGDFFVFIFFGWIGVGGSYYLQAKTISPILMLPATSIRAAGCVCVTSK